MKKIVMLGLSIVLAACAAQSGTSAAPPAASAAPPAASAAPTDLLSMPWDQVVAQAKSEGSITFYTWFGEDFYSQVVTQFKAKYGIEAKAIIAASPAHIDKALAEKDQAVGTIDVLDVGGQYVKTTMDAGIFYGPIFQAMPNAGVLDAKLAAYQEGVDLGGYLVPILRNQTGFLYDPDRVPNPPQTWDEFTAWIDANPKGFAYCDPNKGGTGQAFVQTVISNLTGGIDKYKGDTEVDPAKVADWTKAWDWIKANNDKMNLTLSNNESLDLLNQGAASLILAWDDDTGAALAKGTLFKRAKMYIPTMGLPGGGSTQGILKNSAHKAAALLWLDFLTQPDIQILMNHTMGSVPARTDISNDKVVDVIPGDQRQKYALPWVPAAYKAEMAKQFTDFVMLN